LFTFLCLYIFFNEFILFYYFRLQFYCYFFLLFVASCDLFVRLLAIEAWESSSSTAWIASGESCSSCTEDLGLDDTWLLVRALPAGMLEVEEVCALVSALPAGMLEDEEE